MKKFKLRAFMPRKIIRLFIKTGIFSKIPLTVRWILAHNNHVAWKLMMLDKFGEKEYYNLIDKNSRKILEIDLKVGTDFTGKTIVDVGSGIRGVLGVVKAKRKIGIDPCIDEVRQYFNLPGNIEFISAKAERIPLPDKCADVVVCINTLNHVENPTRVMEEIHRILAPGGLFLFEVYLEPFAPGHPHKFNSEELDHLFKDRFNVKRPHLISETTHEITGEEVSARWGGIFAK